MVEARTRRPVPLQHNDEVEHRRQLAKHTNASLAHDGTFPMTAPLLNFEVTVATLPDATIWEGATIYVSDETGGSIIAFSDGTNWRRLTDRAIVS